METALFFVPAGDSDFPRIAALYNSNPAFLEAHLGAAQVSVDFIREDLAEMQGAGFVSLLIFEEDGALLGLCDFRPGEETYLSLLMLTGACKGQGLGRRVYRRLETLFLSQGALRIRIDVVPNYGESPLAFWEKQGFSARGRTILTWHGKQIPALIMEKQLAVVGAKKQAKPLGGVS